MKGIMCRTLPSFAVTLLLAALIIGGCSSTDLVAPDYQAASTGPEGAAPKLTFSTDYNSPMPTTVIGFELPQAGYVYLEVMNATGYHVRTLVDGEREAGAWEVTWDGTNDDGEEIGAGIYMYHLTASDYELWAPWAFDIPVEGLPDQ